MASNLQQSVRDRLTNKTNVNSLRYSSGWQWTITSKENDKIASVVSSNLQSENKLKWDAATGKAIKFFDDRSNIRRQFIEWKMTTWNAMQDKIWNNRSELADAIRLQFINEWYEWTDWFWDEMLFNVLYKNNPEAKEVIDYYSNNWWDANTYAYYILHPEQFREEKEDSSLFKNIIAWQYDVATAIPRTLATRWAKWVWAIAKWLWADEEKVDRMVQDYIDTTKEFSWEWMWADTDSLAYKLSKAEWELAMFLAWEWAAKWALKWVDVASKLWMWNAPTWVKWLSKWAAESAAEWLSEQALDDMVEQRLSSAGQYWVNVWINAFFNWLWEIWWRLLSPKEKMTKVLKNIDVDEADNIVKQTKEWVKEPLAANPLDKKMDEVVTLTKEVASDKSTTWKILWRIRDFMKWDVSKNISSSLDDINAALNKIDDLWWVQIIKNSDWTFGLSQKVIWWWKELEELVSDMNTLVKNSDNLRWYDQISRLLNKYSWDAMAGWRWTLSAALKQASEDVSKWVDDVLSKYILDESGKLFPQTTTSLAVRWADAAEDFMPQQFFTDLKTIYWEWKSHYRLLSEFGNTLEALSDEWTKGIKKLANIFWEAWWENYYRFLKSLDSLWYKRAWKLADEIVWTIYTMWLYWNDLIEESVKKFYPSVPWLYELWIKSVLDVATKKFMWPKQIAAWKTSISNPVRDAIRTVAWTQYLWEINE